MVRNAKRIGNKNFFLNKIALDFLKKFFFHVGRIVLIPAILAITESSKVSKLFQRTLWPLDGPHSLVYGR